MFKVFQAFGLAILCAVLIACSPRFDWRTIKNEAQGYTAMFPGKPQLIERSITYGHSALKQTLEFAKVDEDVFAIMTTQIPSAIVGEAKSIEQMLQKTLLQQASPTNQFSLIRDSIARVGPMAQTKQATQDFYLDLPQTKKVMRVRWFIRPGNDDSLSLYQISVIRTNQASTFTSSLDEENVNIFFDEFRPN